MKAKVFRRLICITLVIVIIFMFSVSASAAQWLIRNADNAPRITWSYNTFPMSHYPLSCNLSAGQNYWCDNTAIITSTGNIVDIFNKPTFYYVSDFSVIIGTSGSLLHSVGDVTSWNSYFENGSLASLAYKALARPVTTTGVVLENFSAPGMIDYAIIQYNPDFSCVYGMPTVDQTNLVAHEVGHCMGLSHVNNAAVMKERDYGASKLNEVDIGAYNGVYPN